MKIDEMLQGEVPTSVHWCLYAIHFLGDLLTLTIIVTDYRRTVGVSFLALMYYSRALAERVL